MSKVKHFISWLLICAMFLSVIQIPFKTSVLAAEHETTVVEEPTGKKGIIASYWTDQGSVYYDDPIALGVDHALFNIDMTDLVNTDGTGEAFVYNGKTYHYNNIEGKQLYYTFLRMQEIRDKGIALTVQVNMHWSDDPQLQELIFPTGRVSGHNYYALNTSTAESREILAAAFHYLVTKCTYVNNWIVGCEINSPEQCNYCGTLDVNTNVIIAAQTYDLMYQAIQDVNPVAKNYVCLDNIWNFDNGAGIPAKKFLEEFAKYETNKTWHLAFHPYPVPYGASDNAEEWLMWKQKSGEHGYQTHTEDTAFLTGANLDVLSNFVKTKYGEEHRIILTEFGFDSRAGEANQAASLFYTYKAAERDDMIDACIYQPWADNGWDFREMGIVSATGERRAIYDVFKYMDSDMELAKESTYLNLLGIEDWTENIIWGISDNPFEDIYETDYYYDEVIWAVKNKITSGVTQTMFAPRASCSRAEIVTFLWRVMGRPQAENKTHTYKDVSENSFYYDAMLWATEKGIATGYTKEMFAPGETCTRAEIVTFIWRAMGRPEPTKNVHTFQDVVEGQYYYKPMLWAVENKITSGYTPTMFAPEVVVTRGETVTFLCKTYK